MSSAVIAATINGCAALVADIDDGSHAKPLVAQNEWVKSEIARSAANRREERIAVSLCELGAESSTSRGHVSVLATRRPSNGPDSVVMQIDEVDYTNPTSQLHFYSA